MHSVNGVQDKELVTEGFVRFDNEKLNSIYIVAVFEDGYSGFLKYKYEDDEFKPHSIYVTIDEVLEHRYDLDGELICSYVTEGNVIRKLEKGIKTDSYVVGGNQVSKFSKFHKVLKEKKIVKGNNDVFRYFKKGDNVTYLVLEDYCTCDKPKTIMFRTCDFCSICHKSIEPKKEA